MRKATESKNVVLIGFCEKTNEVKKVQVSDVEAELRDAIKRLFKKHFGRHMVVKWFCGVPGVDRAVVWQGSDGTADEYLHVSFSDGRTW